MFLDDGEQLASAFSADLETERVVTDGREIDDLCSALPQRAIEIAREHAVVVVPHWNHLHAQRTCGGDRTWIRGALCNDHTRSCAQVLKRKVDSVLHAHAQDQIVFGHLEPCARQPISEHAALLRRTALARIAAVRQRKRIAHGALGGGPKCLFGDHMRRTVDRQVDDAVPGRSRGNAGVVDERAAADFPAQDAAMTEQIQRLRYRTDGNARLPRDFSMRRQTIARLESLLPDPLLDGARQSLVKRARRVSQSDFRS